MLFLLLASLTVMNMLVGVLCEIVSVVATVENEQMAVSYVRPFCFNCFRFAIPADAFGAQRLVIVMITVTKSFISSFILSFKAFQRFWWLSSNWACPN